jgi:hypothetical protein
MVPETTVLVPTGPTATDRVLVTAAPTKADGMSAAIMDAITNSGNAFLIFISLFHLFESSLQARSTDHSRD